MLIPLVFQGKFIENYFKKLCLPKVQFQLPISALRWAIFGLVTLGQIRTYSHRTSLVEQQAVCLFLDILTFENQNSKLFLSSQTSKL